MSNLNEPIRRHFAGRMTEAQLALHELVESEADPRGIRCDTEWCCAFTNEARDCGDSRGWYVGLVHRNRAERAEARDRGEPFESGVLWASGEE